MQLTANVLFEVRGYLIHLLVAVPLIILLATSPDDRHPRSLWRRGCEVIGMVPCDHRSDERPSGYRDIPGRHPCGSGSDGVLLCVARENQATSKKAE
jgi:hypothetical protein